MREIKFRAYHVHSKKMYFLIGFEKIDEKAIVINHLNDDGYYFSQSVLIENIVLEQYTGLKDKNGVEIYEGDIVEILDNLGGMGEVELTYKVKWNNELCQFILNGINNNNYNLSFVRFDVEIIGNIHENKEV